MKTLVAYFSCTGNTRKFAERICEKVNGTLFEIVPEVPYTIEDLDYTKSNSRSTIEMKDLSSRPKIKSVVADINEYNTIYVGYPIWWAKAPTIINTFLESYDLTNKRIIPFGTYHSSGIGVSDKYLEPSCKNAIYEKAIGFQQDDLDSVDNVIKKES